MVIRKATAEDAVGIATVQTESWKATYKGIVDDAYLQNLNSEAKAASWAQGLSAGRTMAYVADNGSVVGFASAGRNRQKSEYTGELYAIYLLEQYQGKGIGKMLFDAVVDHMIGEGITSMVVWVLKDNPSKYFYIREGGTMIAETAIELGEQSLIEEAYAWKDIRVIM